MNTHLKRIRIAKLLATALLSLNAFTVEVIALQPSVSEVKDSRTTGRFFAGLDVEVSLVGDDSQIAEAISKKIKLTKAVDDTGKNLLEDSNDNKFEEISRFGNQGNKLTLKLKNPARKAVVVKEIDGEIEYFNPKLDPSASVLIPNALTTNGSPIEHAALKKLGISVSVFTPEQHDKQREKEMKAQLGDAFENAMASAFGGSDSNSLIFKIKDPQNKLVSISILDSSDTEIRSNGSMTSSESKTLYFESAPPADAKLMLSLLTDKAVVSVPLKLTDIALP